MGGIFGYVGGQAAMPRLLEGLKGLSYRGHDSAGIAVLSDKKIAVHKAVGGYSALVSALDGTELPGTAGIAHVRHATHGKPSYANAHPHTDKNARFAVVQSGALDNSDKLRQWLQLEGYTFASDTDTETIAHLLSRFWRGDLLRAMQDILPHLSGSLSLCVLCRDEPDTLCCVRLRSALMLGLSDAGQYVASDAQALLPFVHEVLFPQDGEIAMLRADGCALYSAEGSRIERLPEPISTDAFPSAQKHANGTLEAILAQPQALSAMLSHYTQQTDGRLAIRAEAMPIHLGEARKLERLWLVGSGSSYHAAIAGKGIIERMAHLPVEVDVSSEFALRNPLLRRRDACIFISQSGETADTLQAARHAAALAPCYALCGTPGAALSRDTRGVLPAYTGPESGSVSTKGYTAQVMALSLFALHISASRGTMDASSVASAIGWLSQAPQHAEQIVHGFRDVQRYAAENASLRMLFVGSGWDYALAREASQKMRELTYRHAEAFAAGELRHGGMALIEQDTLVVAIATSTHTLHTMLLSMHEAKARGAKVLALTRVDLREAISQVADAVWDIPAAGDIAMPMLGILPMQLFAYYAALVRGIDPDSPRNLVKTVTAT